MIDRLLRFAVVIVAIAFLPLTAEAGNPSPSFAVPIEGQGPAMILIPGFVSSGAVWDDVVAHYKTRYTCQVLTLPGFALRARREGAAACRFRASRRARRRGRRARRIASPAARSP